MTLAQFATIVIASLALRFVPTSCAQTTPAPAPGSADAGLEEVLRALGKSAAKRHAIQDVEQEAKALKAPTGLLGAKWLMSRSDVQIIRPRAIASDKDTLVELAEVYQRSAYVHYVFRGDALVLIIVSFEGGSSDKEFLATQKALESDYGRAPEIAISKVYRLETKKNIGRFAIHHTLQVVLDVPVEQIQFYRTPPPRSK